MKVNPSYTFVRKLSERFDRDKFPMTAGRDSIGPELSKIILKDSELPDLVIQQIATDLIGNTQTWLYNTGLLGRKTGTIGLYSIDGTAMEILKDLGVERNSSVTATEQLWDLIFQEVYVKASPEKKQQILHLASEVNSNEMRTTFWELRFYLAGKYASAFFSHPVVKVAIGIAVWWTASKVIKAAIEAFRVSYAPQLSNHLINKTPLPVMGIVNQAIEIGELLYANRYKIWLSALF